MGYGRKLELQTRARALRKSGFSIKAIERRLRVSRSSVSLWVRDVSLTKKQIER
jgi:transposase